MADYVTNGENFPGSLEETAYREAHGGATDTRITGTYSKLYKFKNVYGGRLTNLKSLL